MKILHVVEPFSSGITTFIINLNSALPHHKHVVLHGNRSTSDEINKVRNRFDENTDFLEWKFARRAIHPIIDLLALLELVRIIYSNSFDIIHLHSSKAGFLGRIACYLMRFQNVIYTPNSAPFARTDISANKRKMFILLEKFAFRLKGKVITCGLSEFELYQSVGITTEYINNGIIIEKTNIDNSKDDNVTYVGFAGIATEQKAPSLFSEIASEFIEDERVKFKWIGDGPLRNQIKAKNIVVTGWLKHEIEVKMQMSSINIYLSTSQWEGQPFAVLEAMRERKALVLFDCVGNRDLVVEGENGFLFTNKEEAIKKINLLLRDPSLLIKMGKRSLEMARKNHDIKFTARKYEEQYESLVNNL